jgi:hypothetical protein
MRNHETSPIVKSLSANQRLLVESLTSTRNRSILSSRYPLNNFLEERRQRTGLGPPLTYETTRTAQR